MLDHLAIGDRVASGLTQRPNFRLPHYYGAFILDPDGNTRG